jgi:hypothetical protein
MWITILTETRALRNQPSVVPDVENPLRARGLYGVNLRGDSRSGHVNIVKGSLLPDG